MADRVTIYDNLKESGLNLWDALSRSADEYFSSKPSFSPSQPFDMRHYVDGNYLPPLQDSVQRDVGNAVAKGILDTVTDPVGYVQDLYYGIADPALSVYGNTGASLPYYGNAALQRLQGDDNTEAMNIADKYSANAITSLGLLGLGIAEVLPSGKVTKPVKGLLDDVDNIVTGAESDSIKQGGKQLLDGHQRLYRGLENKYDPSYNIHSTDAPTGYSTWTNNPDLARQYGEHVYYIDVPKSKMGKEALDEAGDRALYFNNEKSAGLNNVSGDEYLIYQDHEMFNPNQVLPTKDPLNAGTKVATGLLDGDNIVTGAERAENNSQIDNAPIQLGNTAVDTLDPHNAAKELQDYLKQFHNVDTENALSLSVNRNGGKSSYLATPKGEIRISDHMSNPDFNTSAYNFVNRSADEIKAILGEAFTPNTFNLGSVKHKKFGEGRVIYKDDKSATAVFKDGTRKIRNEALTFDSVDKINDELVDAVVKQNQIDAIEKSGAPKSVRSGFSRSGNRGLLDSTPTGVDKRVPVSREDMGILQRVGDVKPVNDLKVEYDATNLEFPEQKVLKAEDLIDRPYMSGMADTSRGGMETIRSINGVPTNTIMWGGQLYVQNPKTGVWANAGTAATGIRNAAQEASEIAGTRGKPLMLPHQMGSAGSMDFNTAIPVLQVQYSRQVMSPSAKKAFDDRIRKGIVNEKGNWQANSEPLKDWVGIDHPNVIDYMNKLGGQRKVVIKALDDFRDEGALSASQARSIIVEPRQQNPKLGNLFEVGNINLDDPVKGIHPTFPVDVLGDYEGTFKTVPNIHKLNPYNRQGLLFLDDMAQRRKPDGSLMYDLSKETQPPNYNKALNAGVIGKLGQKEIDYLLSIGAIEN